MTVERIGDAVLHLGDARDVLRTLPDACVSSVVTDPPYHLTSGKRGGSGPASVNLESPYGRARIGAGFMGLPWDGGDIAQDPDLWREVLRVLKPGGHLLAFGGTRTYHRMTCAIEDAGFEIRDCVMWLYGSGFSKSLDVAKAIDRARIEDIEPVRVVCRAVRASMDARGLVSRDLVAHFGECNPRLVDHWAARDTDSQPSLPTLGQWAKLRELFGELATHDAEVWRLNGRKGTPGAAWQSAEVIGLKADAMTNWSTGVGGLRAQFRDREIKAPNSDAARQWDGWGTALKPAHEPIVVARKALAGTVAANVQQWGTGALNINACRIASNGETPSGGTASRPADFGPNGGAMGVGADTRSTTPEAGRWPANVIHDGSEEVVAAFPDLGRAGEFIGQRRDGEADMGGYSGGWRKSTSDAGFADTGSAARFFYTAKASAEDRHEGIPGTALQHGRNHHATVKPLDLMRYLCRLVTPPGGTVLDCFMGSGSTGKAALLEGFAFVGIELLAEHFALACRRIDHARRQGFQPSLELDGDHGERAGHGSASEAASEARDA